MLTLMLCNAWEDVLGSLLYADTALFIKGFIGSFGKKRLAKS